MNLQDDQLPLASLPAGQKAWLQQITTVFLQCRQYAKALPLLQLLTRLCPTDVEPAKQLATLHYQQGRYEQALTWCRRTEKNLNNKTCEQLYLLWSLCYLKLEQHQAAHDYYLKFIDARATS